MKKVLSIILAIALIATLCTANVFAAEQEDLVGNFCTKNTQTPVQLSNSEINTYGSLLSIGHKFTGVYFGCPSWSDNIGSLTLTLWKWDTNYKTTTASTPIKGPEAFADYEDNSFLGFSFEEAQEAGLYYMEISEAEDSGSGVGIWTAELNYKGQAVFVDGEYVKKANIRTKVDFAEEFEGDPYGEMPEFKQKVEGFGNDNQYPYEVYFNDFTECLDVSSYGVSFSKNEDETFHVTVAMGSVDSQYPLTFTGINEDYDPYDNGISCSEYPYMALRLKLSPYTTAGDPGFGECFFYTSSIAGATGGYSASIPYDWTKTDEWQTVVIDPTTNTKFKTNALENEDVWLGMRFDVLSGTPSEEINMDIAWIAFFGSEEAAKAFDGDFENIPEPTAVPTAVPTAEPTAAPTAEPAAEPTEAPKNNGGCGSVIGSASVVVIACAALVALRKKEN